MASATTLSTPQEQVESLMKEVAEQNGLEVLDKLADNPVSTEIPGAATSLTTAEEDKLSRRFVCCVCVCVCVTMFFCCIIGWHNSDSHHDHLPSLHLCPYNYLANNVQLCSVLSVLYDAYGYVLF